MSIDLKALRALLAEEKRLREAIEGDGDRDARFDRWDHAHDLLMYAAVNALPALLDLADAVRELAPVLAILSADNKHPMQPAARRVLAILEEK